MKRTDVSYMKEAAAVGAFAQSRDGQLWACRTVLRKWHSDQPGIHLLEDPDELHVIDGNILTIGGASAQWQTLIGGSAGITLFNNANARIGVGDGTAVTADTQIDLQGTNKLRKAMDATYPLHTDSISDSAAKTCTFRSTFGTTEANWAWNEWGIFNGLLATGAAAGGRMLNRKVPSPSLGTKTSGTWQLAISLTLSGGA